MTNTPIYDELTVETEMTRFGGQLDEMLDPYASRAKAGIDANPDEGWDEPAPEQVESESISEHEIVAPAVQYDEPESPIGKALKAEFGDIMAADGSSWDRAAGGILQKILFNSGYMLIPLPVPTEVTDNTKELMNDAFGRRAD